MLCSNQVGNFDLSLTLSGKCINDFSLYCNKALTEELEEKKDLFWLTIPVLYIGEV